MQRAAETYFVHRMQFYSARMVASQGWKGQAPPRNLFAEALESEINLEEDLDVEEFGRRSHLKRSAPEKWSYELKEVYIVAVCDFKLHTIEGISKDYQKYWKVYASTYINPQHSATNAVATARFLPLHTATTFILLSLPNFTKSPASCEGILEKFVWLLGHLGTDRKAAILPAWFEDAELQIVRSRLLHESLSSEEKKQYERDLKVATDAFSFLDSYYKRGRDEGEAEGIEKGELRMLLRLVEGKRAQSKTREQILDELGLKEEDLKRVEEFEKAH
ncbi:hypothetical protein HK104_001161 [Borealophlyctis nickersoniae]|nr:hypothetical protein HK104_001161 [Borealophlyctis nickersoniae]